MTINMSLLLSLEERFQHLRDVVNEKHPNELNEIKELEKSLAKEELVINAVAIIFVFNSKPEFSKRQSYKYSFACNVLCRAYGEKGLVTA